MSDAAPSTRPPALSAVVAVEHPPAAEPSAPNPAAARPRPSRSLPDKVHTWPFLVRLEMIAATAVMASMTLWSILVDAPLDEPANPTRTPNPSKAPWYFLGLQELLVYFDPWLAGVVLPFLIIVGLMAIPYLDVNPRGNGYYSVKGRAFAISTFLFGFLVLWIATILIGTFLRGPGWNLFWPGAYWDPHRTVASPSRDFPELFGITTPWAAMAFGGLSVIGWLLGIPAAFRRIRLSKSPTLQKLGPVRYWITSFLFMAMTGTFMKIVLRLCFSVRYVMAGPHGFNI